MKVLYFTAHSERLFEHRAALADHEAFLDKPVTGAGLLEAVSLLLYGTVKKNQEQQGRALDFRDRPMTALDKSRKTLRVLVVDDEEATTLSFARMLRLEGFEVDTALDGEAGLRVAAEHPFDAILLDMRMPLLDGLEFLRRLRTIPSCSRTPVAIVTGYYLVDEGTVGELEELGAVVRYKPLWLDDLIDLTRTLAATR